MSSAHLFGSSRKSLKIQINFKGTTKRVYFSRGCKSLMRGVVLHELDRELEKQGLRFIRYADDFSIYTKTKATARKTGNAIFIFLKNKLKLPINREKSGIRRPVNFIILCFGFVPTYVKGERGIYQLIVSEKS